MTDVQGVYRRVLRRETHAARTAPAVIVASILGLLLIAALVLGTWAMFDAGFRKTLGGAAADAAGAINAEAATIAAGVVLVVIALLLIGSAVLPGRRNRRGRVTGNAAVLIDDGVLADAAVDRVASRCGIDRSQVSAVVGRRAVHVRVTPTSGLPIDRRMVKDAVSEAMSGAGFDADVKVSVSERGVVQ